MKIGYYPGCSAKGSSLDYELSSNEVCRILGIVSSEIDQWNCCGSTPAHAVSTELSAALCTRNLVQATKQGADVVMTPCPSCLSNLLHAKERMKNPDFKKRVDELLDEPSPESLPEATSVMQMIGKLCSAEDIKKHVRMSLAGIRIAPYYGCLMSRPADLMNFGDPENPTLMEELLTACGADSIIDFPLKTECCGASAGIPHRPLTSVNSGRILDVATKMEADCIVVCCPLCQMNLDLRQKQAERQANARFRIPVLYYTQLMGLAFGCDPKTLGLGKLIVSADRIVDRIQALNTARMEATGGAA
ncbi:MAG: CoB--CoM heterodisulfide reductase iron-sulfur subunit B family protein [Candidatus Desulfovibrio faecigallinarum]|nr:CoB--CoM heterodisulfide reductase iron-sulfur subunit B family protein [Candidatus Desulfovibrio faecigallinarum]OUO50383.1 heterodisulfide reductase subunit B [Desulfovibrio sp. An276]